MTIVQINGLILQYIKGSNALEYVIRTFITSEICEITIRQNNNPKIFVPKYISKKKIKI